MCIFTESLNFISAIKTSSQSRGKEDPEFHFYLPKVILNENSCEWNWKSITRNKQVVQIFHAQDYDKKSVLHV